MIPADHQIKMLELSTQQYRVLLNSSFTQLSQLPDRTQDEEKVVAFLAWALLNPKTGVY